jgi:anti-sigma regulatory factor (Ser/Thr protein kinase)
MGKGLRMADRAQNARGRPLRAAIELPAQPQVVSRARGFVKDMIELWDCEDLDGVAVLLTSEIVTNAIRYSTEAIRLELSVTDDGVLTVETADNHPDFPCVRPLSDSDEGGRGMRIVAALARNWGVRPVNRHKVVWFEVPVRVLR